MAEPMLGVINPGTGGSTGSSGVYTAQITANEFVEILMNSSKDIKFVQTTTHDDSDQLSTSRIIYSLDGFTELDHPDHTIIIVSIRSFQAMQSLLTLFGIDDEYLNSDQDAFYDRLTELGISNPGSGSQGQ